MSIQPTRFPFLILDENNKEINTFRCEWEEQALANKYIEADDCVLELGARYGSVSCVINSKLANKKNQVSVEPDDRVWDALERNRDRNSCVFHIVKGFVSKERHSLTNLTSYRGYGTESIPDPSSTIPSYSLEEVQGSLPPFTALVADCEGFLERFLQENPQILNTLRILLFEEDCPDRCNYTAIKTNLRELGFLPQKDGKQQVWLHPTRQNVV